MSTPIHWHEVVGSRTDSYSYLRTLPEERTATDFKVLSCVKKYSNLSYRIMMTV